MGLHYIFFLTLNAANKLQYTLSESLVSSVMKPKHMLSAKIVLVRTAEMPLKTK